MAITTQQALKTLSDKIAMDQIELNSLRRSRKGVNLSESDRVLQLQDEVESLKVAHERYVDKLLDEIDHLTTQLEEARTKSRLPLTGPRRGLNISLL